MEGGTQARRKHDDTVHAEQLIDLQLPRMHASEKMLHGRKN